MKKTKPIFVILILTIASFFIGCEADQQSSEKEFKTSELTTRRNDFFSIATTLDQGRTFEFNIAYERLIQGVNDLHQDRTGEFANFQSVKIIRDAVIENAFYLAASNDSGVSYFLSLDGRGNSEYGFIGSRAQNEIKCKSDTCCLHCIVSNGECQCHTIDHSSICNETPVEKIGCSKDEEGSGLAYNPARFFR